MSGFILFPSNKSSTSILGQEMDPSVTYLEKFQDESADVIYHSSDGIGFRVHSIYLKIHTGGLAPPEGCSLEEPARLTEPAAVLEPLFEFIYPNRQPDLTWDSTDVDSGAEFEKLMKLAEAAEKYLVFPAMYACFLQLRAALPDYAVSILGYALKHDYHDLTNETAPHVLHYTLSDVLSIIPSEYHRSWLIYYNKWLNVQKRALTVHRPAYLSDVSLMSELAKGLPSILKVDTILGEWHEWRASINTDIANTPSLTDVIGVKDKVLPSEVTSANTEGSVVIQSPDGRNHIQRATLEACAVGLGNPVEDIIAVPESFSTISLLLQFIRPVRSPDLNTLDFPTLKNLAFAAEKYAISQAMWFCRLFMMQALSEHAQEVFQYAARFKYPDILDEAAPLVLPPAASFEEIVQDLPSDMVVPWAKYYQIWEDLSQKVTYQILQEATKTDVRNNRYRNKGYCDCGSLYLESHIQPILERLLLGPGSLRDLDKLFDTKNMTCGTAINSMRECREPLEKLLKNIGPISSFVNGDAQTLRPIHVLLSHVVGVTARYPHSYGRGTNILREKLGLSGVEAADFILLVLSAALFAIPLGLMCALPFANNCVRRHKIRGRYSLAKYPVIGAATAYSAYSAVKTVVLSQSHVTTLKSPLNAPVASAVATFMRQLSFTILFIAIAAGICWRLQEYSHQGEKAEDSTSDVPSSRSWKDHNSSIRLAASFLLLLMFASALAQVIISTVPSRETKVNVSDALSHVFLAIYLLITLAFCVVYWKPRSSPPHGATGNRTGGRLVYKGLIPMLILRGIYEIAREVVYAEAKTQHGINLMTFDLVDTIMTTLTYFTLCGLTFLTFWDEQTDLTDGEEEEEED